MSSSADRGRAVVVMAKRPAPGVTKTRLAPALTPAQAADFYECLLLDTIDMIQRRDDCTTVIAIDQPESSAYFSSVAPGIDQVVQAGAANATAALGDRLATVLTACLERGFRSVFAISSDSPDLPGSHLNDAFVALDRSDVDIVLGPTEDGGYYLIGWKQPWPAVVSDVVMSTPQVLEDTLAIARSVQARTTLVSPWYDVDTPDDLPRLRDSLAGGTSHSAKFLAEL